MSFGTLMRALLLGLGVAAASASVAETAAPAERQDAGANMARPAPAGAAAAGRPRNAAKKVGVNRSKGATDRGGVLKEGNAVAAKRGNGTGEAIPDDTAPAAESQSVALRGVRG